MLLLFAVASVFVRHLRAPDVTRFAYQTTFLLLLCRDDDNRPDDVVKSIFNSLKEESRLKRRKKLIRSDYAERKHIFYAL